MWQTKLGKCIHTSPSGCRVYQNFGYRWFTFGSEALQTVINRRSPHKPVLHYLPALTLMARQDSSSCCLLGLGGAGVVHMLSKIHPEQDIVAVDNNLEVINIANDYFMLNKITNLTVVHDNALNYLNNNYAQKTKHLLVDLYDADHFPEECHSNNFFYKCHNILEDNGFLAINLANTKDHWPIFKLIKHHFKTTLVIPIKKCSNMVIIACKKDLPLEHFTNCIIEKELKKIIWTAFWGWVASY